MYRLLIRPILFIISKHDAEIAHHLGLFIIRIFGIPPLAYLISSLTNVENSKEVFGITFKNPVGLAAGFDKQAEALKGLETLGFGFIEVGTVTSLPQEGNPRPRLFRLKEDEAIINRMGFNNFGKDALAKRVRNHKRRVPIGINIGKGKDTPVEKAVDDYRAIIPVVYEYADYITVNVSSPNTKNLRQLQEKEKLSELLTEVGLAMKDAAKNKKVKPLLLKIAPDLSKEEVDDVLEVSEGKIDGLIVHNTSIARPESLLSPNKTETGGLSGKPLRENALGMVSYIHSQKPELPIIGVGGIFSVEDAKQMLNAGASLVQIYTGFIYEGPMLPSRINRGLL